MFRKLLLTLTALFVFGSLAFAQPVNDNCSGAIPLTCTPVGGTNAGATVNTGFDDSYNAADICALSLENTVWYQYCATATGTVNVNFTNINCSSGFGVQLGVFSGPCGGPYTPVGTCVNGYPPPPLNFPAVNGQCYYIVLDGDAGDNCTWDVNVCPPGCAADAGTQTILLNGVPTASPVVLCTNDCIDIISNDDYVMPPPVPGEVAELMYAIYSCPPPATPDPGVDACYTGLIWTGEDFNDCNNGGSILLGAGLGPQVWYLPITADDGDNNGNPNGVINWDNNGDGCWDVGAPIEITYTSPITFTSSENCSAGTVDITISGGGPQYYPTNYIVTNTGAGTVTGTPVGHGGTITITGLLDGQNYSISVTDPYGCTATFAGGPFNGPDDPTITPAGPFCESDAAVNLNAATGGGTWSGTGITNGAAGTFNPAVAGPGSHVITYTLTVPCLATDTETIVVNPDQDATITPVGPFCESDASVNLVGADPGGTWSGTGITNGALGTFDPATAGPGTHTITYAIPNPCGDTQTTNITVNPDQDATITPVGPFCESDASLNLTAVDGGGTWSGTGITNGALGTFDPATAGPGTHTITYAIPNPCGDTQTTNITVNPDMDATITPAGPFCANDAAVNLTAVDGGGTWSGPGITNGALGTFDPATAGPGTHTITYSIPNPCGDTQTTNITVNPNQDATITPAGPFCPGDPALNLVGADPGGTWSGTGITDAVNGTFDPATAGPGTHTITYSIPNPCGDTQNINITVNNNFDATITAAGPFCEGDAALNLTAVDGGGTWSGTGITDAVNGTFDPATAGPGTHTITYTITGSCGDTDTENIVVNPDMDATITPAGPFCPGDPAVNLVGADPGGTWSGTGITDAVNGTFDPATAGAGTHTITYSIPNPCGDTQTYNVVVNNNFDATITPAGPFCESDAALNLAAVDGGGTWSGTGITDAVNGTFDPATAGPGTHTITYTIAGSCGDIDTENIVVNPDMDATITPVGPFCTGDPALNLVGVDPGGTWSGTGITDAVNGTFDPATAGPGTHTITYSIPNPCGDTQTTTITVNNNFDATITPAGPFCTADPATNLTAVDPGGTWTGTGITDGVLGTFDPATAGAGTHTITYTIAGSCGDVQTTNITVNQSMDATITPVGPFCPTDPALNLVGADPGGTWSGTGITDAVNGTFDPVVAGPGTHTITYSIPNPCGDTQTVNIVINASFDATITPAGPFCESDAATNMAAVDGGGTWTGTGITDAVLGTFDPAVAGPGTHTITYTIAGSCGDTDTENIVVNPDADATITPAGPFCPADLPVNMVGADPGGTWSGTGITDPVAGTFDPATAGAGTHTITYAIGGPCPDTQTFNVVVSNSLDATITPAGPFCESDPSLNLTAVDPGGTWTGNGITDGVLGTFDPATAGPGTHTITYTIPGSCGDVQTEDIVINADADATITPVGPYCTVDPAVNLVGADPGGTWSGNGITDPVAGTFDPATAGPGTHTITYAIGGPCPDTQTLDILVSTQLDATINPAGPFCESNIPATLAAADPGGTWSGNGITDPIAGTFDPATAGPGTHTITYTIGGSCGDTQTEDIIVIADDDATITPAGPYCTTDPATTLIGADPGGTWTGNGITNAATGDFDPAVAGPGTHTITYTISGACGDVGTINIVVSNQLDATITPAGPFCELDASVTLTAVDGGGTWSGTGITDPVAGTFDPNTAGPGTHTITYDIPGACGDIQTTTITVNPNMDATITPAGPFCLGNAATNLVGADPGGTWSGNGITDPALGTFDPAVAGVGTHTITYTIGPPCGDTQTFDIVVTPNDDATITGVGPFCADAPAVNLNAATGGGTWSGNGITDPVAGTFDPGTAGAGTHTITYTIPGPCGDTQTTDIVVNAVPAMAFVVDNPSGCLPHTVTFTDNSLPAGTTCSWNFGDNNTSSACGTITHTYTTPGCFDVTLTITTADGCTNTLQMPSMVCAFDYPTPDFLYGPQPTTITDPTINFTNTSTGASSYLWDFGGLGTSTDENPSFTFPNDSAGAYNVCLIASNGNGCADTVCYPVIILDEFLIYVPNAFTPDGDGVNDFFAPVINAVSDVGYDFYIFNRWGELIFHATEPGIAWDGTYKGIMSKQEVYVWKVYARVEGTAEKKEYVGHVTLLR